MRMALQVLQSMRKHDVNSWNAAVLGLAVHGEAERVFQHFDRMTNEDKLKPNSITFVGVLSACNHRGLVNEGRRYFDLMMNEYEVEPVLQHYGCLIDLLARRGRMNEALDIVSSMPVKPDDVIWRSLLDASCKRCERIELSQEMAKRLMEGDGGGSSGDYVLLSRVFASANKWDEVGLIRKLMMDKGVGKEPGCSSVEVDGVVHEFFAGDTTHPQSKEIHQFLDWIEERVKTVGYVHDLSQAPMVDEARDRKGDSLRLHSERLAIAFALLNAKPGPAALIESRDKGLVLSYLGMEMRSWKRRGKRVDRCSYIGDGDGNSLLSAGCFISGLVGDLLLLLGWFWVLFIIIVIGLGFEFYF